LDRRYTFAFQECGLSATSVAWLAGFIKKEVLLTKTVTATIHYEIAPAWAIRERALIDLIDQAVYPYVEKCTRADHSLIWADRWSGSRDGMDDLHEAFANFAQFTFLHAAGLIDKPDKS
jgi:hypothetical protein